MLTMTLPLALPDSTYRIASGTSLILYVRSITDRIFPCANMSLSVARSSGFISDIMNPNYWLTNGLYAAAFITSFNGPRYSPSSSEPTITNRPFSASTLR